MTPLEFPGYVETQITLFGKSLDVQYDLDMSLAHFDSLWISMWSSNETYVLLIHQIKK